MLTPRLGSFVRKYGSGWVIGIGPLLLLGWRLASGEVLFWGTPALQFVPWWVTAWKQLAQGSLPVWNPNSGLGAPLLANYQTAFFYPPNWILCLLAAVFGAAGVAWGYTFLVGLHLAWAGWGMARLAARLGLGRLPQVVCGLSFGLCGYIVARMEFISMVWVAAWLPWVILYSDELCSLNLGTTQSKSLRLSVPLAICVAMQMLAGHAQLCWYTFQLASLWVLVAGVRKLGWKFWRPLLGLGLSLGIGAMLAAIQLMPTAEYLLQSQRASEIGYSEAMVYSFWPWRLITLVAPDFFGNPGLGNFWGYATYWEDAAYIGLTPLILALSTLRGLFKGPQSGQPVKFLGTLKGFLWILILVSFLLALGQNTPVFPFLYHNVPTFAMFQAPARYLLWAMFGLALLAAIGVERWRCPTGRGLYWLRLGTAGAFAVSLGAGLAWANLKGVNLTFIRATALAGWWALGTGGLTLLLPVMQKRGWLLPWKGAVVAWILADLLLANWNLNPMVQADFYNLPPENAQTLRVQLNGAALYIPAEIEARLKFRRFLRFQDYSNLEDWQNLREVFLPNLNLLDGIPSLNNFDPLLPGRYVRWIALVEAAAPQVRLELLRQAGVGALERIDVPLQGGVRFDALPAAPRFQLFGCASWLPSEDNVLAYLDSIPAGEPFLILEGKAPRQSCAPDDSGTVQVVNEKADEIRLQVDGNSLEPVWLLARISLFPGWQASLDGKMVDLLHANYLFMGLAVPPGSHSVILKYHPDSFYLGGMLSILVALGLIARRLAPPTGIRRKVGRARDLNPGA